ncbi:MAG: D-alanine--D-alanine ligase [Elusimicrobia bacterium HGW-Elusimicrobia-1]|jgi:D-alanine-D-alanine ligase|nr:MAG: D-alanine--D-alanine ligase [Elusimicrobia bacterium HGW-Elusimicrobia-1]
MKKLKVGFTYDAKADYKLEPGDAPDKYAEFDSEETLSEIEGALKSGGHEVVRIGHARSLLEKLRAGEKWDIVFNIAEGIKGRNREAQVPVILEMFDIPYVGSDGLSMAATLDKAVAKILVSAAGVRTPRFMEASSPADLAAFNLKFPVIVKPAAEGTSKGVSGDSRVSDIESLKKIAGALLDKYRQTILVEEFVSGKEFTVAVIGNSPPEALPPVQVSINGKLDLGDDFYFHARVTDPSIKYFCPSKISKSLDDKLKKLAVDAYKALGCRDLSRIDIRTDRDDEPFFLECNPLPNLGLIDVFPLVAEAMGTTYEKIVLKILEHGAERYGLTR